MGIENLNLVRAAWARFNIFAYHFVLRGLFFEILSPRTRYMNSTLSNITTIDRANTYCRLINLPSQIESQDRVLLL